MHDVTINVGTMKNVFMNLKLFRRRKLPLEVETTINYDDLKKEQWKSIHTATSLFVA